MHHTVRDTTNDSYARTPASTVATLMHSKPQPQGDRQHFTLNAGSYLLITTKARSKRRMSAQAKISYVPLQSPSEQIRALTLHAGGVSDPIECSLQVVSLQDSPEYQALSYTWGDPGVAEYICVDGVRVRVTVNLEIALRHTRHVDKDKLLCVDAANLSLDEILKSNTC